MHELCTEGLFNSNVYQLTKWRTLKDICQYIGTIIDKDPVCIETGTTFQFLSDFLEHHTTNNITKYICQPNSGILYSIDIEPKIDIVSKLLQLDNVSEIFVKVLQGYSINVLTELSKQLNKVDLLCLDSAEDPDNTVNEYNKVLPLLKNKHIVMVDDIHNGGSVKYIKIIPLLKELGYSWVQVPTPTGMFVAFQGYKLPKLNKE